MSNKDGASALPGTGLSPSVEPASGLAGFAASIPDADLYGDNGVFARFAQAALGIQDIARQCREIAERHALSAPDIKLIQARAYEQGIADALKQARGTNADMCQTPQRAYRVMCEAINDLRHKASRLPSSVPAGDAPNTDGEQPGDEK